MIAPLFTVIYYLVPLAFFFCVTAMLNANLLKGTNVQVKWNARKLVQKPYWAKFLVFIPGVAIFAGFVILIAIVSDIVLLVAGLITDRYL